MTGSRKESGKILEFSRESENVKTVFRMSFDQIGRVCVRGYTIPCQ